jgi:hypothetical protein
MIDTPELNKLSKIDDEGDNQIIGEFLEWAGENGYHFTKTVTYTDTRESLIHAGRFYDVPVEVEQPVEIKEVIAHYFGIDLDKVRAEKEAVYASLRAASVCQRGATG